VKCFYHDDLDGRCAAFWVHYSAATRREADGCPDAVELIAIDHRDRFPTQSILPQERIYIVDYSVSPDQMQELLAISEDVTWIDHHTTAIARYADHEGPIRGIRVDGVAACVLTFLWLHRLTVGGEGEPATYDPAMLHGVPAFTAMIGERDTQSRPLRERTRHFCAGLLAEDTAPNAPVWLELLEAGENTGPWESRGAAIETAGKISDREYLDAFSFECEFEGYRAIACNKGQASSDLFADAEGEYDLMIAFVFDGSLYSVGLFSKTVDVGEIAQRHGGGGQKGAAGFECTSLPFRRRRARSTTGTGKGMTSRRSREDDKGGI
jgi:hypothetical protein